MIDSGGKVIVAAGARSSQLLMVSGIGNAVDLMKWDIAVKVDNKKVGRSMGEHPSACCGNMCKENYKRKPDSNPILSVASFTEPDHVICFGNVNFWRMLAYSYRQLLTPLHLYPFGRDLSLMNHIYKHMKFSIKPLMGANFHLFTYYLGRPEMTGTLTIKSNSVFDQPIYNYKMSDEDNKRFLEGLRLLVNLTNNLDRSNYVYSWTQGHPKDPSDEYLLKNIGPTRGTFWHPCGGCGVGDVVDTNFDVKGVENLSVIGSPELNKMPTSPLQSVCYELGRYFALCQVNKVASPAFRKAA